MISTAQIPSLLPALPEILLAAGAMALLMVVAYRGERSLNFINGSAIAFLLLAAVIVVWLPGGKLVTFGSGFVVDGFARFLKVLTFIGSAAAIVLSLSYLAAEKQQKFEYAIL